MEDSIKIQDAVNSFKTMPEDTKRQLSDLNARVQAHTDEWGRRHENERTESGTLVFPWVEQSELIQEFVKFMYDNNLIVKFSWPEWQAGRDWYSHQDEMKYDGLDVETALKLLTAVIRNDRFNEGALVQAFEDGSFPKIIQKLITI